MAFLYHYSHFKDSNGNQKSSIKQQNGKNKKSRRSDCGVYLQKTLKSIEVVNYYLRSVMTKLTCHDGTQSLDVYLLRH
jgi:hypothetical protein